MPLVYREDYWDSPALTREFKSFMIDIFELDLSLWENMGFWDVNFRPFSYFEGSSLIANVCVYSMDMVVDGKRCRAAQISSVGTRPNYRRKGLGLKLARVALDWARKTHDYSFLFADDEAYGLYQKCGFRYTDEYNARITVSGRMARPGALKLDMERTDHIEKTFKLASDRQPVSDILGVYNEKLFMFWCLYELRDHIYYIPGLEALILCKRNDGKLTIFDIVCGQMPSFAEIYPYISDPHDKTVDFLFMVDKLNLGKFDAVRIVGNGTHLLGGFPLEDTQFTFPYTSHA